MSLNTLAGAEEVVTLAISCFLGNDGVLKGMELRTGKEREGG